MQIYQVSNIGKSLWEAEGCGTGLGILASRSLLFNGPSSESCVAEIRLFTAGPVIGGGPGMRRLCLMVRTNTDDLHLYSARKTKYSMCLQREKIGMICRSSSEIAKHRMKVVVTVNPHLSMATK